MQSSMSAGMLLPGDRVAIEAQRLTIKQVKREGDLIVLHFHHWSIAIRDDFLIPSDLARPTPSLAVVDEKVFPRRLTRNVSGSLWGQ